MNIALVTRHVVGGTPTSLTLFLRYQSNLLEDRLYNLCRRKLTSVLGMHN